MMRKLFHLRLSPFELVDFCINVFELFRVVGAIIFPLGHIRNFLKRVLIDVDRLWPITHFSPAHKNRHLTHAPSADTDRINLHVQRLRRFGRRQRLNLAGIILPVSHQDDDFTF